MKKSLILGILFLYATNLFSQEEVRIPFSVAISAHIVKYNQKIDEAYREKDTERGQFLFDSLVNNHLVGTYMDPFKVNSLKGEITSLGDFEKHIFLVSYASWCVPGDGEIPAFNDLVDRFHDQIDFVVLFWDTKETLKEKAKEYNENAKMVYVDEKTNQDSFIINKLKHALGFPMTYFLDEEKKIMAIRKVITHHSSETLSNSYNIHFNSLSKGVSLLIADMESKQLLGEGADLGNDLAGEEAGKAIIRGNYKVIKDLDSDNNDNYDADNDYDDNYRDEFGRTAEERRIDEEYERYRREKEKGSKKKKRKKKKEKGN